MPKPVVAIIGRPNVGKSTLFNRLCGKRISIVNETPGVTRDRIYGDCEWSGRVASIIDTAGLEFNSDGDFAEDMLVQTRVALDASDLVIFVTSLRDGITAADEEICAILKKSNKPVILCVNKCDNLGEPKPEFYEFYNLGLGEPMGVSSIHGIGTGDLLDKVFENLPDDVVDEDEELTINVSIIGRPNAGKSSLLNRILGENRSIVSGIEGTTRDVINEKFTNKFGTYNFIDTAGLRRKSRISDLLEKYSVIRTKMAIENSDVCVIMVDAVQGLTEQDSKIAGLAHEAGKGCIVAVNKWDVVEKDDKTVNKYREDIRNKLKFMSYAPEIFISAKTGQRVDKLFELINSVSNSNATRIRTGTLNEVLLESMARVQPPTDKGKRLKIYYVTQVSVKPPTFVFFVNIAHLFHFSYQRYIENRIRSIFGLEGTPIRFITREKKETNLFERLKKS